MPQTPYFECLVEKNQGLKILKALLIQTIKNTKLKKLWGLIFRWFRMWFR